MSAARRMFASDNASGAHPAVLDALRAANEGHAYAYGDDEWTRAAEAVIRRHLGDAARAFFVFNGTGANATALAAVMRPYEAVICPATAHINVDECGAPERFTGGKLLPVDTPDGKLTPELVERAIFGVGVEHHSQARVVSISQSTEYGTVYRPDEIAALAATAHDHGMLLHVDGARISNAAASLDCSLSQMLTDTGVDVVSLGGTKNGMLFGEAVVFLRESIGDDFRFVRKQGAQLASKMRYIGAQFVALFGSGLWLENARHANEMARLLADGMRGVPGVRITQPVEANEVFATLPREAIEPLQREFGFYVWDERTAEVRWVTSWDTTPEDVAAFVEGAKRIVADI
ncbi:low specificity L-threonine aldolase [Coriobacteriia bacterium Es71-Z0120]|uniref:threonine aldolase family protein n=1 Tax=Parvivirga hydrogeniphila TaxID=2939460 RepID=UPI002260F7BA|nr:low specificity L-threonine aldolase [Parvivirga hydrogeniphila]MCL4078388.1 low specificity L-threonine aldolase [Parvivirga hydrogeniphila]